MALTSCKECVGTMSDRAKECPHCGCPNDSYENENTQSSTTLQNNPQPHKSHRWIWPTISTIGSIAIVVVIFMLFGDSIIEKQSLKITPEFSKAMKRYDKIDAFSEGLAAVCREGKWGYIDLKGNEVIPCQFSDDFPPGQFSEGLACVVDERSETDAELWNKRVGFINKKGELVLTGDFFTESPMLSSVWGDVDHQLPSFKDGKCAVWDTAVYSLEGEGTESGVSKEYEASSVVLVNKKGNLENVSDSIAQLYIAYRPYQTNKHSEDKRVVYDDYAITISRDTLDCDNGAKLISWVILDENNFPYNTNAKGLTYIADSYGNSTLYPDQKEAMDSHLNSLMALLLEKHNEQLRREAEEYRRQQEASYPYQNYEGVYNPYSSSNQNSEELRIMQRLHELGSEGKKLISEMETYRSRGQLDPLNAIYYKQACLNIKDQQIDLARQLGDPDIVYEYQLQRRKLEAAFQVMGIQ